MANIIIVTDGDVTINEKVSKWFQGEKYKIILIGLMPAVNEKKFVEERSCWHDLFTLQEYFDHAGFSVSIGTEKGSVFNVIGTVQSFEAELLILPKSKFLSLASDEYDDFLEQVKCPIVLY